jgi:hypothetical protein
MLFPFIKIFPVIGPEETRSIIIFPSAEGTSGIPPDEYALVELYCVDRNCDCRRVMINVISGQGRQHLATISHSFDPPPPDHHTPKQTFLDPFNTQSRYAKELMEMVQDLCLSEPKYAQRLRRHYRMVKDALDDITHPIHDIIRGRGPSSRESRGALKRPPRPKPPPPRGKRKWR